MILDGGVDTGSRSDADMDTDTSTPRADGGSGGVQRFVVDYLELAPAPYGVNVDGLVSFDSDQDGCFFEDHTSPFPDAEDGVDNNFGPLLEAVGSSVDTDVTPSILSGETIFLLEVRTDGASQSISLYRGAVPGGGAPSASGGGLVPGQTFDVLENLGTFAGTNDGGRTRVGPADTRLEVLPGGNPLSLFSTHIYGEVSPVGISDGVIGGALSAEELALLFAELGGLDISTALSILEGQSDIPSVAGGTCNQISAAMAYSAVPASFAP